MQIYQSQLNHIYRENEKYQKKRISTQAKADKSIDSFNQQLSKERSISLFDNSDAKNQIDIQEEAQRQIFSIIKHKEPVIAKKYLTNPSYSPLSKKQVNNSVIFPQYSAQHQIKKSPQKQKSNSFLLPSISPEKKGKKQIIGKLEEYLQKFHTNLLEILHKENSSFSDISYLGHEKSQFYIQKKFYSDRLHYNILSKNYIRNQDGSQQIYNEEKVRHKGLEGKISSIVDLLAYDDVGMRLFYESGVASLKQMHDKYRKINISFSENDLLCLMRQMICNTIEFIQNKWFYNNYQDLNGFVFVKQSGYQEYQIKYANLVNTSNNQNDYHFENIVFSNTNTNFSQHPSTISITNRSDSDQKDEVIESQLNSIYSQNEIPKKELKLSPQQINLHSDSNLNSPDKNSNSNRQHQVNKQQYTQTLSQSSSSKLNKSSKRKVVEGLQSSILSPNQKEQNETWQKIQIYEVMQICSLIYNIFLEQNFANIDIRIKEENEIDFLSDYPKLQDYLLSFIKNSQNQDAFQQNINKLRRDKSIPQFIQIEDTIFEQIKQEQIQMLNLNYQQQKLNKQQYILQKNKNKEDSQISVSREEIKSIAMIAVQTINKQLQNELQILQCSEISPKMLPENQEYYDKFINSTIIQHYDKSSLLIVAQIADQLLARINEQNNPFYYAEQIYCKALAQFKSNSDSTNNIQLLKFCNQIIQKIQGNELNELCGKSYLLMSQITLKLSNNRSKALEYAQLSYEIRKQVHGSQSRTIEFVDSLKQISFIYQMKGQYEEAFKYLEKAYIILQEIQHELDKSIVQVLTELSILSYNIQNFQASQKKCLKLLEIYKKSAPNVINYCFPFAMNLYSLVRLRTLQNSSNGKSIDNQVMKDIFKTSLKAQKLIESIRDEQKSSNFHSIYYNIKVLFQNFLKSIESEEYLISLQKTPEQKPKSNPIYKRVEPFSLPTNPIIQLGDNKASQNRQQGQYNYKQRSVNYINENQRNIIDISNHF
ncbi:hypothetical protein TTHERM_00133590 (macronuclear) [Tetrahymena thermophila SB210]|uniref:Tetratricopeptide repeat protein n=1 Tax=Tetrahymena thermophila (strain SB210) TaxID=312017 RepID=I7MF61_TETTS|nr:hypothetical protein TTHERM_00133590 [Tetrahymena thermophila SB210]EAR99393.2 hypothetical protein TTHERM_00133590 [Tetrahymena thermophila SB210]|eukprot:XP_001019638.2 hypothetical protein TTHERM_00133590 [Tetrahymena thermophila SB210]